MRAVSLAIALSLTACVSESPREAPRVEQTSLPPIGVPSSPGSVPSTPYAQPPLIQPPASRLSNYPRTIQESNTGPAVLSLYKRAQDASSAHHPDQAAAFLQRALHIEPRNAFVWQALAGVQLDLAQPDQAEGAAQKSSSLGRNNPYLDAGNWRIIATARQAQGDTQGAAQAQARADQAAQAIGSNP